MSNFAKYNLPIKWQCEWNNMHNVYEIKNNVNGFRYYGYSNSIYRRITDHYVTLKKGRHINPKLQEAYNIYGEENFSVRIIFSSSDPQEALLKETRLIERYKNKAYNKVVYRNFKMTIGLIEKFQSNIKIDPTTGCHIWGGNPNPERNGYIRILYKGREILTHRVAYKIRHKVLPHSGLIGHACNNKKCCNADHLYLTNYGENNRDAYGERREALMKKVMELYPIHKNCYKVGELIGISPSTASKYWKMSQQR